MPSQALLAYDDNCGFCTRVARQVPRLRLRCALVPLSTLDLPTLGIDEKRARHDIPFVDADGEVFYGHRAWAAALRTGPLPCRLAGAALTSRLLDRLAERAYDWVARNRGRLPGIPTGDLPRRS